MTRVKARPQHPELRALLLTNSVWVLWRPTVIYNKGCETGPPACSPYPRRLESLTICWCNYKGSTFCSVILRPWVLVRPESNSRPPAWEPDAQRTELPVCRTGVCYPLNTNMLALMSLLWSTIYLFSLSFSLSFLFLPSFSSPLSLQELFPLGSLQTWTQWIQQLW